MKISFHGGKCCGIKIIHNMGSNPNEILPERDYGDKPVYFDRDKYGEDVSSDLMFFYGKVPKETYLKRLDRFIAFLDKHRPKGVIEITLSDYDVYGQPNNFNQVAKWEPLLLERGFVLVTKCLNSNSNNNIYIYHRKKE